MNLRTPKYSISSIYYRRTVPLLQFYHHECIQACFSCFLPSSTSQDPSSSDSNPLKLLSSPTGLISRHVADQCITFFFAVSTLCMDNIIRSSFVWQIWTRPRKPLDRIWTDEFPPDQVNADVFDRSERPSFLSSPFLSAFSAQLDPHPQ